MYFNQISDVPTIKLLGDIIRLRRFNVNLGTKNEVILAEVEFSNWLIYSIEDKSNIAYSYKDFPKN